MADRTGYVLAGLAQAVAGLPGRSSRRAWRNSGSLAQQLAGLAQ